MIKMTFFKEDGTLDKEREFDANIVVAHDNIILFLRALECWESGMSFYDIEDDTDPDWCDDWSDDVDETNYDPYLGCDFYDCAYENDWGW